MSESPLLWWPAAPAPPYTHSPQARQLALLNLATDEAALLLLAAEGRALLRAYCNPPAVILGLSRRLAQDVDVASCAELGIPILRRASGGGTVIHDPFVLNFAWVLPWSWLPGCGLRSLQDEATSRILECLIMALRSLGLGGTQTRISDVSIGRPLRKIAGSGQMRKSMGLMHHVSVLLDLDLQFLEAVLPVPPDRPGVAHRDFVTSMKAAGVGAGLAWGHGTSSSTGFQKVLLDLERRVLSATCQQFEADFETLDSTRMRQLEESARRLIESKYGQQAWIERM